MRIGLCGFVLVTLVVGISSCSGGENDPQSASSAAGGGIGGTEVAAGSAGGTTNGAGGASGGGSQTQSSSNTIAVSGGGGGSIGGTGASTIAVGGSGGTSVIAVGGTRPASSAGSIVSWLPACGARPLLSDCGLPVPGSGGIAKPSGTPGNLRVLNWAGFKAAATYTFDDANSSQITNYAALNGLGVPLTFFLWTSRSTASDPTWARAVLDGHELGNHTQSHAQTGTAADVDAATTFIEQHFGVKVWTMAAPYGDASYVPLAETRFLANRGVAFGYISANGSNDPFNLPCYLPPQGALASTMNAVLDSSRSAGAWQIVLVHGFTGGNDGAYQPVAIGEFVSSVNHNKAWGDVWIDSMVQVAAYWRAQKMFSAVAPTTSGTDRTWTWTLPDHFPPGKCLRVNVDGGSLKQGGGTLAWNDHGFYEIALDEGSLTLSSGNDATGGSGGASAGAGGSAATGGTSAGTGGSASVGGTSAATGGSASVGGTSAGTGGSVSVGGTSAATGGSASVGGTSAGTGGSASVGGTSAATGGSASVGGTSAGTGGSASVGGTSAGIGGSASVGGTSAATGGSASVGGTSAGTGGSASVGGTSAATGGSASVGGTSAGTGGSASVGGTSAATGGFPTATGGSLSDGGSFAATGGSPSATGGSLSDGGSFAATGGSPSATGGSQSDGGSFAATGGALSDGGSNAATGGSALETGGALSDGGSNAATGGSLTDGGSNAGIGGSASDMGGSLSDGGSNAGIGGSASETGGSPTDGGSNAGTGGSASETGGSPTDGGSNAATGGSALAGATGVAGDISATGVIELSVPLAADGQDQGFDIYHLSPPLDLSGATVTARVYAPNAINGQITLWLSSGGGASAGVITAFTELNAGYFEVTATVPAADGTFDPSQIDGVHLEVQLTSSGPWQSPTTIVYLDSVVSSNGILNDTFDTSPDASLFVQSTWQTVSDSSFTWLANYP